MKRLIIAAAIFAALLAGTPTASARSFSVRALSDVHVGKSKPELVAQRDFSADVVRRLAGSWQVAPRHATCWSHVPWSKVCDRTRRKLLAHRWLHRVASERLAAMAPPAAGHWRGWSCITNGAYPKAPHEGNGYNGLYSGPLGMTTPWAGYMPPGRDWVHSNVGAVYAIAEKVAATHGFNYGWMHGQWPNTFPPCAAFFQ